MHLSIWEYEENEGKIKIVLEDEVKVTEWHVIEM